MKHKQGLKDFIFIIFFIAIFAFLGLVFAKINSQVNDTVQNGDYGLTVEQLNEIDGLANSIPEAYDQGIIIAFLISFLVLAITSLLLDVNALFFLFGLVQYIFTLIMVPVAANIFIKAYNVESINAVAQSMPMTSLLIQNYVVVNVLLGSMILGLLYMRSKV